MSAKYEITFHKELSMFNCSCGFFGLSHHCTRKIKGTISIVSCPEDCKLCHKEADRKEYISLRWKKTRTVMMCVVSTIINSLARYAKAIFTKFVMHSYLKTVSVQSKKK